MELREFLYLDEELVNQFVSQLDFGLIDYEQVTQANEKTKGGEVGGRFAKRWRRCPTPLKKPDHLLP
ncbi:DUF6414 family protein [Corynebacterium rouxii]